MRNYLLVLLISFALAVNGYGPSGKIMPGEVKHTETDPSQSSEPDDGFSRATAPRAFHFPEDHGPHPSYQTEWWYFTGNLQDTTGRHYGYQLTFFRRALFAPQQIPTRESNWGVSQVYMAHFSLTDIDQGRYQAFERLSRGAASLAGATGSPFQVWLYNWRVDQISPNTYQLTASKDGIELKLTLTDAKGPILHGEQGYSQKGPAAGQASFYYSLTRLITRGSIKINNKTHPVEGLSWMDHEFSTSALSVDQVGWDWFSVQLDNGAELMVFQIRRKDGSIDPFSSGTWIAPDGSTTPLTSQDFRITVEDTWKSPHTEATYPSRWNLSIPKIELNLTVDPYLPDQELNVSYVYWEGAVRASGKLDNQPIAGDGYVELTGYTQSMGGEF